VSPLGRIYAFSAVAIFAMALTRFGDPPKIVEPSFRQRIRVGAHRATAKSLGSMPTATGRVPLGPEVVISALPKYVDRPTTRAK
jgi:hypothetical protein